VPFFSISNVRSPGVEVTGAAVRVGWGGTGVSVAGMGVGTMAVGAGGVFVGAAVAGTVGVGIRN